MNQTDQFNVKCEDQPPLFFVYFRILDILRQKNLIGKMSPNEVLFEFSKVYLIYYRYYSDGEKRLSEIPAKAEKIERILGLNLFPKTLRS